MKIEVRFHGIQVSEALREHVTRRSQFQLGRFHDRVRSVIVKVGDVNGPKGGVDKRALVTVRGPRLGAIRVEQLGDDAYAAAATAIERAAQAVGRVLERARAIQRPSEALRRAS